jgi:hypothetical protein
MPRTRKDCPICGKKILLKLSNHLADFHQLSCEEREQYLTQARLNSSACDRDLENLVLEEDYDIEKALKSILKRQESMEANFNEYLRVARERHEQSVSNIPQRRVKRTTTKKNNADNTSMKWLSFP